MDLLEDSRKKKARLFWTLEREKYNVSNVLASQRPARVVNYDEEAYIEIVLKREKRSLEHFTPTPPPRGSAHIKLDPLPNLSPLEADSPRSLQLEYMYYCDEVLRRSVDPHGKPLKFDFNHFLGRLCDEYEAFGVWKR